MGDQDNQEQKADVNETKKSSIGSILKTAYTAITVMAAMITLSAATYAWFSSNSVVDTDKVKGRSGADSVELQISSSAGDNFKAGSEAALVQVNTSSSEKLVPISTSDLRTFVISAGMVDDKAVLFEKVTEEKYFYHGRIYLKAAAQGHEGEKLALYLDGAESGGGIFDDPKGYVANAARLGLMFDGGSSVILRMSEGSNPDGERMQNSVLNGTEVKVGHGSADPFQIVGDPSVPLAQYMVGDDGLAGNSQVKPLILMELNRIYTVDVYFYLEGCDPDCTDAMKLDSLNLHLAFYGILTEEAN